VDRAEKTLGMRFMTAEEGIRIMKTQEVGEDVA